MDNKTALFNALVRILLMILSRLAVTLRTQTVTMLKVNGSSKSQNIYHDFKKNWENVTL